MSAPRKTCASTCWKTGAYTIGRSASASATAIIRLLVHRRYHVHVHHVKKCTVGKGSASDQEGSTTRSISNFIRSSPVQWRIARLTVAVTEMVGGAGAQECADSTVAMASEFPKVPSRKSGLRKLNNTAVDE